jgi:hypothetical protein
VGGEAPVTPVLSIDSSYLNLSYKPCDNILDIPLVKEGAFGHPPFSPLEKEGFWASPLERGTPGSPPSKGGLLGIPPEIFSIKA